MQINALYVIIKLAERCNLKCSYCYYYTDENSEVFSRPSLMPDAVLGQLLDYAEDALNHAPVKRVVFGFHGGEPTLAKAARVRSFCREARARLESRVEVSFAVQTNGVHLSDDWVALMHEEQMGVGISIDGSKEVHDAQRMDHRDRGSYDRVEATVRSLLPMDASGRIRLTALTVMGPEFSGVPFYRHLVEELGLKHLKLLFMDRTAETPPPEAELEALGAMLCDVFDYWLVHHAGTVDVTLFDSAVRTILASKHGLRGARDRVTVGMSLLSDGRIRLSDDFMVAEDWYWSQAELAVGHSGLKDFLAQPHFQQVLSGTVQAPAVCNGCPHVDTCAGGELAHRYTSANGFANRSVYCTALTRLYDHIGVRLAEGEDRTQLRGYTRAEAVAS